LPGAPGLDFQTWETMNLNYAATGYFLILGISLRLACHKSYCVCIVIFVAWMGCLCSLSCCGQQDSQRLANLQ
jgi:hypothetical protein